MKIFFAIFLLFSIQLFAQSNLQELKTSANVSISREMKALENSKYCINTASSVEDFKNCNYDPHKYIIQKEETLDTGTTTERVKSHKP